MIDALVGGQLHGKPVCKIGRSGRQFVTAKVRAAPGADESIFINVIAFVDRAKDCLLELDDGDSVAISGALTPKAWLDRSGAARPALDMVASAVLTPYHVRRKRAALQGEGPRPERSESTSQRPREIVGLTAAQIADDRLDDVAF